MFFSLQIQIQTENLNDLFYLPEKCRILQPSQVMWLLSAYMFWCQHQQTQAAISAIFSLKTIPECSSKNHTVIIFWEIVYSLVAQWGAGATCVHQSVKPWKCGSQSVALWIHSAYFTYRDMAVLIYIVKKNWDIQLKMPMWVFDKVKFVCRH